MQFSSDNQRRAVFANMNAFSRAPKMGELVYVPGGLEGQVINVYDKSADVRFGFGSDAETLELDFDEFEIEKSLKKKFSTDDDFEESLRVLSEKDRKLVRDEYKRIKEENILKRVEEENV